MPGQDAFLDVLTNMVGIIILLVVIVGIRSSRAAGSAAGESDAASITAAANGLATERMHDAYLDALQAKSERDQAVSRALHARTENLLRAQERDYLVTFVAAVKQELEERRDALSTEEQRDYDLRRRLAETKLALEEANRKQISLMSQPAEEEVLEVRPTPIVRRNLNKELFLQISQDYVGVVPLEDLYREFETDIAQNIWRLRETDRISGFVGPIGNFRMRYVVERDDLQVRSRIGEARNGSRLRISLFELLAQKNPLGEPVEEAIAPDSELSAVLKDYPPDTTTIKIAVYPNSIRSLHVLKRMLHDAGYGVAEMLLPSGHPIRFSPDGVNAYAQ
jgi:hypothetical protein